jgi:hypothetical protein
MPNISPSWQKEVFAWNRRRQFSIRNAVFWNPATGAYEGEATRSAHVYVFCVHAEQEKSKANVLDVSTWDFYVVPTASLNQVFVTAKSLSLSSLARVAVQCKWSGLKSASHPERAAPDRGESAGIARGYESITRSGPRT